jgi:hypothetical protein
MKAHLIKMPFLVACLDCAHQDSTTIYLIYHHFRVTTCKIALIIQKEYFLNILIMFQSLLIEDWWLKIFQILQIGTFKSINSKKISLSLILEWDLVIWPSLQITQNKIFVNHLLHKIYHTYFKLTIYFKSKTCFFPSWLNDNYVQQIN